MKDMEGLRGVRRVVAAARAGRVASAPARLRSRNHPENLAAISHQKPHPRDVDAAARGACPAGRAPHLPARRLGAGSSAIEQDGRRGRRCGDPTCVEPVRRKRAGSRRAVSAEMRLSIWRP